MGRRVRSSLSRRPADGWFHRLDGDQLVRVVPGISVANGLAFSPDGRKMYATGRKVRQVDVFDLDPETGTLSQPRLYFQYDGDGFLDGATVDQRGGYWIAIVGAGVAGCRLPVAGPSVCRTPRHR
jgi:sugar lactone lactonase YvrE